MNILYLFSLAFAVSLDSFGVGITYGMRKIKIPLTSIILICTASALSILLSMSLGGLLNLIISANLSKWMGSIILISVGIFAINQVIANKNLEKEPDKKPIVIQILKTPMKADMDNSGMITAIEAILLGLALSLDAFAAGLGLALIGFNPLVTALTIAVMSGIFILFGMKVGFLTSEINWIKKFSIVPGLILIIVGLLKII